MPEFERYWKNPEKYRAESNERVKKLVRLGYKKGFRNVKTYLKALEYNKRWNKRNRAKCNLSEVKRRAKVKAAGFNTDARGRYYYSRVKGKLKNGYPRNT